MKVSVKVNSNQLLGRGSVDGGSKIDSASKASRFFAVPFFFNAIVNDDDALARMKEWLQSVRAQYRSYTEQGRNIYLPRTRLQCLA